MLTLATRNQLFIAIALTLLMVATRGHHFATLEHLPGASWAVFFLAGLYLRPAWTFTALLALAALIDYLAVTVANASTFCISPAYLFLLPAYGALWLAGHWYARRYRFEWRTLMPLSLAVIGGATVSELLSSGGFYFFSGRFAETTLAEFGARLVHYFPASLQSMLFYIAIAAVSHSAFVLTRALAVHHNSNGG